MLFQYTSASINSLHSPIFGKLSSVKTFLGLLPLAMCKSWPFVNIKCSPCAPCYVSLYPTYERDLSVHFLLANFIQHDTLQSYPYREKSYGIIIFLKLNCILFCHDSSLANQLILYACVISRFCLQLLVLQINRETQVSFWIRLLWFLR